MSEEDPKQDPETLEKVKQLLDDELQGSEIPAPETYRPNEQEERIETDRNNIYDNSQATQSAMYAWSMMVPELGDVEVSELEKARYLKAALNDVPVILPIELEMGLPGDKVTVHVRTLNNYEMDVAFHAIEADKEEGLITGPGMLATKLQQYAGAMQLVQFNGKDNNFVEFNDPGDPAEDAIKLRAYVHTNIGKMGWPKWQAVLKALAVFETKIKLCNDAALNGNFWNPLGADS